jgi:endonuclease G, mitochondrial
VFAGPILDPADQVFVGVGDGSSVLRAKIPSRFWKVIVARVEDGIAAYAFVLEQDLKDVEWEFTVPSEFVPHLHSLADLQDLTGVAFDKVILEADQYDSTRGEEVRLRAGARRRRRK